MKKDGYNGWANYETWNVALWIGNEEHLYDIAKIAGTYEIFLTFVGDNEATGDGVNWRDSKIDVAEINQLFNEL